MVSHMGDRLEENQVISVRKAIIVSIILFLSYAAISILLKDNEDT